MSTQTTRESFNMELFITEIEQLTAISDTTNKEKPRHGRHNVWTSFIYQSYKPLKCTLKLVLKLLHHVSVYDHHQGAYT